MSSSTMSSMISTTDIQWHLCFSLDYATGLTFNQSFHSCLYACKSTYLYFTKLLRLLVLLWLDFANFYHTRIIGLISLCVFIRSLCQHIISVLRYTYRERLVGPSLKIYCSGSIFKREGERLHIGARTGTIKPVYLLPLPVAMSHSSQTALDEAEAVPDGDFVSAPFTTRREPLRDLINTFSDLYIDSDDESVGIEDNVPEVPDDYHFPPPPPPPEIDHESNKDPSTSVTSLIERLTDRFTVIEDQLADFGQRVSTNVPYDEFEKRCKKIEERMSYRIQRECEKVKNQVELLVQELGQSVVDCLKRRDHQLEHRFQSLLPSTSTPIAPVPALTVSFPHSKQRNATYSVQSSHLPTQSSQSAVQYNPPVKLDFPTFSSTQEDDPVVFIEHCEEYFAVRPLSDGEILASLTAVLKGTAKDWWMAERRNVYNWRQFKESFLHSFLSEDSDDVAARKLLERKQGAKESIRDFAFHYRALCLRWRRTCLRRKWFKQYFETVILGLLVCYAEPSKMWEN